MLAIAAAVSSLAVGWVRVEAQPASKRIAALDLIPIGVADGIARATTELIRRAVGKNPRYRLAPAPLRLRPMLLALGCARLDAPCLGKIGKQLEVERILFGELARQPKVGDRVTLRVFDVASAKVIHSEVREIGDPPGSEPYVTALEDTTHLALGDTLQLQVDSNVEGAIILANGQPVGTTPFAVTEGLRAGRNTIIVRRPGYEDFRVDVVVRPGRAQTLRAELKTKGGAPPLVGPVKPPVKPPADGSEKPPKVADDRPLYKKWWFWTIVGAVVVGSTAAGIAANSGGSPRAPSLGVEF
jgi:hypothetical protein